MNMEVDNDIINSYLSLLDSVEKIKLHLSGTVKNYSLVHQMLLSSIELIDLIIAWERNHNSFLALCQQKQQLTMLIHLIEKLVQEKSPYKHLFKPNFPNFFSKSEPKKQPEALDNIIASTIEIPKVSGLNEIIGLHETKKILRSLVILPKNQPQLFYNRRISNSILLFGPPGTGKTRLSHALAAEANVNFHCISASDVLSHYVGQTEKTIKTLFQHLKQASEFTILFIDEIDALCRKRTGSEQDHTRRIKTELMCQISSVENCRNLVIISATNCPWDLDSAILRRLQKRIYVPLPNCFERGEFFQYLTNNVHFDNSIQDWTPLVKKTEGYSGSDLCDAIQAAMTIPLNELEDTKIWKCCDDGFYEPISAGQDFSNVICCELKDLPKNSVRTRKVCYNDIITAVDTVRCTVMPDDVKAFEAYVGLH